VFRDSTRFTAGCSQIRTTLHRSNSGCQSSPPFDASPVPRPPPSWDTSYGGRMVPHHVPRHNIDPCRGAPDTAESPAMPQRGDAAFSPSRIFYHPKTMPTYSPTIFGCVSSGPFPVRRGPEAEVRGRACRR